MNVSKSAFRVSWGNLKMNAHSLYSSFIALVPVIMIINVPILNIGWSTFLLGVTAPYVMLRSKSTKKAISVLPIVVTFGYLLMRSMDNTMNLFLLVVVFVHAYAASKGSTDASVAGRTIETVAVIATVCVMLQTLLYYTMGIRFNFLIPNLILEENRYAINVVSVERMYRPSAFFLEPSHYTQYCSLALMSVLMPCNKQKVNFGKAIWIAVGCILTTSGMGIALCIGIFAWYAAFTQHRKGTKLMYIVGWFIAGGLCFAVLMQFTFFSNSIQRVFGEVNGYNAIWGRTLFWESYVGSMSGSTALFGHGTLNLPTGYMTGLMKVIYCYGYLGMAALLLLFIYLFARTRSMYARCACVAYCALMCIANLFGFISLSFWIILIISESIDSQSYLGMKKFNLHGQNVDMPTNYK